jgi:hypothetical protein
MYTYLDDEAHANVIVPAHVAVEEPVPGVLSFKPVFKGSVAWKGFWFRPVHNAPFIFFYILSQSRKFVSAYIGEFSREKKFRP